MPDPKGERKAGWKVEQVGFSGKKKKRGAEGVRESDQLIVLGEARA